MRYNQSARTTCRICDVTKRREDAINSQKRCRSYLISIFLITIALFHMVVRCSPADAQLASTTLRMSFDNRLLKIEAENADIKDVLTKLASTADIAVEYPVTLKKAITYHRQGVSLRHALKQMLIGINHILIYSGTNPNQASISKVMVLGKAEGRKPASAQERRLARRIKTYRRQIDAIKHRLSKIDANSSRGKRYLRQIKRIEGNIERLERQLY
jgi:hypothetical protein